MISTKLFVLIVNTVVAVLAKPTDLGVIGGNATNIDEHPWMVSLFDGSFDEFLCGGFLISESWVVTAGHCAEYGVGRIQLGSTDHNDGENFYITQVAIHPNYSYSVDNNPLNDIALIQLASIVSEATAVPIGLPEPKVGVPVGTVINVTGWGLIDGKDYTQILYTAPLAVISAETCEDNYRGNSIYDSITLCAGQLGTERGACSGDSGGPAELNGVAVGIVSWTMSGCAETGFPTVFTNLTSYRSWIHDVTGV